MKAMGPKFKQHGSSWAGAAAADAKVQKPSKHHVSTSKHSRGQTHKMVHNIGGALQRYPQDPQQSAVANTPGGHDVDHVPHSMSQGSDC